MDKQQKKQWREFREWKSVHDYEKKLKKPPSVRGSRRVRDKETGEWSYVPRSGYAGGFLQLFSLFLLIIVVWNVATGAGYSSYKLAVGALYSVTESVGFVVKKTSDLLVQIKESANYFEDIHTTTITDAGYWQGKVLQKQFAMKFTKDSYEVMIVGVCKLNFKNQWVYDYDAVYSSNHPDFSVGDKVRNYWFFGHHLRNVDKKKTWSFVSFEVINYPFGEE